MKLSILTTVTSPNERQDKWREAIESYCELADEVVVVDGSPVTDRVYYKGRNSEKVKYVHLFWAYEWNWIELPRHLNAGLGICTGDWVLKLDIDQFIHEDDFEKLRVQLELVPEDYDVATFQKMTMLYGGKYYQKGGQGIAFRRKKNIVFGKDRGEQTDLCFPVYMKAYTRFGSYDLPVGTSINKFKTGISYWNYDYYFKTKEFTKKEFFRFSRAYERYFGAWNFGSTEEESFNIFLQMQKSRYEKAPYTAKLEDHSRYIRSAVNDLLPTQFGWNGWGLI